MESFVDSLVSSVFSLIPFSKEELKALFERNDLLWVWKFVRDYLFSYKVWLLGFLPAFLLQFLIPARKEARAVTPNLVLDAIYPALVLPIWVFLISGVVAAIHSFYATYLPFANLGLLDDKPLLVQAIGIFLVTDLMFYVSHRVLHEVKWFWYFHSIHHSQTELNPLTTNRNHPCEVIVKMIIRTVPIGLVGGEPSTWVVYLVLNNFWGYFIHSNLRINLGPLKYILVTPQYHRVHHSREPRHFDQNYGERLILWDWLFGSLYKKFDEYPATGVPGTEWILETTYSPQSILKAWLKQMAYPFVKIYQSLAMATAR